jgi:hypothetical protein
MHVIFDAIVGEALRLVGDAAGIDRRDFEIAGLHVPARDPQLVQCREQAVQLALLAARAAAALGASLVTPAEMSAMSGAA